MAMLAESRSKQKWSEDPRNTRWANDKSKFGYQLMSRMGWSEGQGLGVNLNGATKHVGVRKKKGVHGVGASAATDDNWIAHQDDFNALLGALNQGVPCAEAPADDAISRKLASLESSVKRSTKKIMYTKYVRGKDLSRASANDLASIFGQRSKSAPSTPQLSGDEAANDSDGSACSEPVDTGMKTVTSAMDMNEYFAAKMAAFKLRREARMKQEAQAKEEAQAKQEAQVNSNDAVQTEGEVQGNDRDILEELLKADEELDASQKEISNGDEATIMPIKKKKKKKKDKRNDVDECTSTIEEGSSLCTALKGIPEEEEESSSLKPKKKKKKKTLADEAGETCVDQENKLTSTDNVDIELKKKKKKKKISNELEVESTLSNTELEVESTLSNTDTMPDHTHVEHNADVIDQTDSLESVQTINHEIKKKKKKKKKNREFRNEEEDIIHNDKIVHEVIVQNDIMLDQIVQDAIVQNDSEEPDIKKRKKKRKYAEVDATDLPTAESQAMPEQRPRKKKKKKKKDTQETED